MTDNLHSDSWCPLPFNAISFHPTGALTRCMMSNVSMGESYDSEQMQQLRQDMLDGKWDKEGCMSCWKKKNKATLVKDKNGYSVTQRILKVKKDIIILA